MNETRLIGKKAFNGKQGKTYYQLYVERDITDFDKRYAVAIAGKVVDTLWVDNVVFDSLVDKDMGKNVYVQCEYINGRSQIVDVKVA